MGFSYKAPAQLKSAIFKHCQSTYHDTLIHNWHISNIHVQQGNLKCSSKQMIRFLQ